MKTLLKIIKYIIMIIVSIVALAVLVVMIIGYMAHDPEDNLKREQVALQVRSEIEVYRKEKGVYSPSLSLLAIANNENFKSYHDEGIIRYTLSDSSKEPHYTLIWVNSGVLTRDGSKHSFSWSGKQYSDERSTLQLLGEDAKPDANGFYEIDLH